MPINMSCPSCGKTLAAPDSAAGKKAKCPSCSQIMIVPGEGIGAEMSSNPPPPPSTLSPRAARAPGSGTSRPIDEVPPHQQSNASVAGGESWLDELGGQSAGRAPLAIPVPAAKPRGGPALSAAR